MTFPGASYVCAHPALTTRGQRTDRRRAAASPIESREEVSATVDSSHPPSHDPSDSLHLLRQHWWLMLLAIAVGVGGGGGYFVVQQPVWEATTEVLVHPVDQDTNVAGGGAPRVNLDTEAQLVRSTAVAAGAAEQLGDPARADELARQVTVDVPANTAVLMITFAADRPQAARDGATAFAEAYLAHRDRAARQAIATQAEVLETKIGELDSALAEINERLAHTHPDAPATTHLDSQRTAVSTQLGAMSSRLNELTTATVSAGQVISQARTPSEPARPHAATYLGGGAAIGLVFGIIAAAVADRTTRRIRRPRDLTRRLGLPVAATLATAGARGAADRRYEIVAAPTVAGQVIDRLRNEVLASTTGQVILVTSAVGGPGSTYVAGNLAASLARSGHDVIVVGARAPDHVAAPDPLTRLFGIPATPGLSEVLAGRVAAAEALHPSPRHSRLSAMAIGDTASTNGLLQHPHLRDVLRALVTQAEYVVVDAPATTASADAQSLARLSDMALLAVQLRRTRLSDVADAADQLRRVGTPLLGTIIVPSLVGPDPASYDDTPAAALPPSEPDERVRTGPPRPHRSGPHLPVLGTEADTIVIPRTDDREQSATVSPG